MEEISPAAAPQNISGVTVPTTPPAPTVAAPAIISPPPASSSGGSFLSSLNWTQIIWSMLGATALYCTIFYFRYKGNSDRQTEAKINQSLDNLNTRVQDLENELQPRQSFDGGFNY